MPIIFLFYLHSGDADIHINISSMPSGRLSFFPTPRWNILDETDEQINKKVLATSPSLMPANINNLMGKIITG